MSLTTAIILLALNILLVLVIFYLIYQLKQSWQWQRPKGLIEYQTKKRMERREKILKYLDKHDTITNDIVQELINVSDAQATRVLQQLEDEAVLKQIKKTGRDVKYQKLGS